MPGSHGVLHNMSSRFWLTAGYALIGACLVGALISLYFGDHGFAMFLGFVGTASGGYLVNLGRWSKVQGERGDDQSPGL
jgi:hypothetical protein